MKILLMSADGCTDMEISDEVGLCERPVVRVRQKFVKSGVQPALTRKDAGVPKVIDGRAEAQLITIACSTPPEGRDHWTLQMLCGEMKRQKFVKSVCQETVRQALKKNKLRPWATKRFCIAEKDRARFVERMEEVLDVYQEAYDEQHPLICMDEASRQVLSDVTPPLPMKPGAPKRIDDKYERQEFRSLLMFYDPVAGWRRVSCRESRTRTDWALEIKQLLDVDYPNAELVTLVCDNLNTHDLSSLYFAFDAETARRLKRRIRLVHTPKNGSWLNTAEMELSLLSRQCLGERRFATAAAMDAEITAWQTHRNTRHPLAFQHDGRQIQTQIALPDS